MTETDSPNHSVYHFGGFTLNRETYELRHGEQVIELEPKLFHMLSILVRHHPRVVTKDELLNEIWDNRVVTDNAISRAIYQLRKIIDQSESDSLIKTVRGVGYQLNCSVESQHPMDTIDKPARVNRNRSARWFMGSVLIIAISALGYFLTAMNGGSQLPQSTPDNPRQQLIAILPLETSDATRDHINLSHTLMDYLTIELQSGLGVRVIHPDRLIGLKNQKNSIKAIQQATQATHIIEGFISEPKPDLLRLHLTLYQPTKAIDLEPYSLGTFDFPWPDNSQNLQTLYKQRKLTVSEIAKLIQPKANLSLNPAQQTADPMTFRLVIASHHSVTNDQCQGVERAIELLKQAVQRDPDYAYGWHQLMSVYFKSIWLCGHSSEYYDKALQAANQVERLARGRYPSVAIARNAVLIETNRVEDAYEINRQYQDNHPMLIYLKVTNLRYAGFLQQAKPLIGRIIQLDPYYYNSKPISQAPNTLLYLRDYESHLNLLAPPGNIYHDYYRALNWFVRGRVKQAVAVLKPHIKTSNETVFHYYAKALYTIGLKDNERAHTIISEVVKLRQNQNQTDGEMTYKQAQLYALAGDQNAAIEQLKISLQQGFFPAQYWQNDPAMATLIDNPRFKTMAEQAQQRHRAFAERFHLTPEF